MSTELLENLGAVRHALSNGDRDNAIDLLVHMRSAVPDRKPLDKNIERIRSGDLNDAREWVDRCMERAFSGAANIFADTDDQPTNDFEEIELDLDAEPDDWDLASVDHRDDDPFGSFGALSDSGDSEIGRNSLTGKFSMPSPSALKSKKSSLLEKLHKLKSEASEVSEAEFSGFSAPAEPTMEGRPQPAGSAMDSDPFASLAEEFASDVPADDDFDLGPQKSNERLAEKSSVNTREVEVEDDDLDEVSEFDFDLGFENPAQLAENSARETKPNPASTTKPRGDNVDKQLERERDYTPLAQLSAIKNDIDDEFFALAESLSSESSDSLDSHSAGATHGGPNPQRGSFRHEELTGMQESSVSLAEESAVHTGTNMSAILLEARRLYDAGEFEAALDITKKVLSRTNDEEALNLRNLIEGELERKHLSAIGSLNKTPTMGVKMSEISTLDLDHRAGFILSQIDGMMTYEDLIELSGMSRLETLEVLAGLIRSNVIAGQ